MSTVLHSMMIERYARIPLINLFALRLISVLMPCYGLHRNIHVCVQYTTTYIMLDVFGHISPIVLLGDFFIRCIPAAVPSNWTAVIQLEDSGQVFKMPQDLPSFPRLSFEVERLV